MFKKMLARFGKGAAKVDLRFENRPYAAGETVYGEVHIQGGEVEQKINSLAVSFMMRFMTKQDTVRREIAMIPLSGAQMIYPSEQKVIPFSYVIPTHLPISREGVSYYFDTHLDIQGGIDRMDFDDVVIDASKEVQTIFYALKSLGFQEKSKSGKVDTYGQEFSFVPTELFVMQVNEIEMRLAYEGTGIRIWLEIDCRNRYEEIEAKREFFISQDELRDTRQVAFLLKQYITEITSNPYGYIQSFSYETYHHSSHRQVGSQIAGMVGGLAVGILGGVLLNELIDDVDIEEIIEEAVEEIEEIEEDAVEELEIEEEQEESFFWDDEE